MTSFGGVVIVGAGQAGLQTAASLREESFVGDITLIGDEPVLPYRRPPLSKEFLRGSIGEETILLRPAGFFIDKDISVTTGRAVRWIDRSRHEVELIDGVRVAYDHLVLATGARSRTLPLTGLSLDGVVTLRSQADAQVIRTRLPAVRSMVVIGGGFIGLEVASTARAMGLSVTVVEAAPCLLARSVSQIISDEIFAYHKSNGITFHTDARVREIVGDAGRVTGVVLDNDETLPADLVLISVGACRNDGLAAAAGLAIDDGIVVDRYLLTSDPLISAVGDCVALRDEGSGRLLRIESVQSTIEQARAVARRLVGRPAPFVNAPWFWSDQGGLRLQIVGFASGQGEAVASRPDTDGGLSVFRFDGPKLLSVESVNRPIDHAVARRLFKARPRPFLQDVMTAGFALASDFEAAVVAKLDRCMNVTVSTAVVGTAECIK